MFTGFYTQSDLPGLVGPHEQCLNTPNRLAFLIAHDTPDPVIGEPPVLVRSYSNYGCVEFDPVWHHEQLVLKSFFKHWDLSGSQIEQALQKMNQQHQQFSQILKYCVSCGPVQLEVLFNHRNIIRSWISHGTRDECVAELLPIFELVTKFFAKTAKCENK